MNPQPFDITTATLLFLISVYISFPSNGREKFLRMFCSLLVIYHVVVGRGEVDLFLKEKNISRITPLCCKLTITYNIMIKTNNVMYY